MNTSKIALGTVQFGLNYGISNSRGKIPETDVDAILSRCSFEGLTTLDTAGAYGDSESVLGRSFTRIGACEKFNIVSKLPPDGKTLPLEALKAAIERLNVHSLYGFLFHHFQTWAENPGLWHEMQIAKESGLTKKIGFSLYSPSELRAVLDSGIMPDLIQVPFSVLDQRFNDIFDECKEKGIEIHVRSAFLQGLVFMKPERLDPFFSPIVGQLRGLSEMAESSGISLSHLCLAFPLLDERISKVVIGVESLQNLEENLKVFSILEKVKPNYTKLAGMACSDDRILLPMNWPRK